jgi:predicted nucleic acid-binding protein
VILIDSSAWVEYLRATGSPVHLRVHALLAEGQELACTDVITMEILAGARDDRDRDRLRRLLQRCVQIPVEGPADYEQAADLYRACRRHGETPRKLTDCLISVVAIRNDAALLHNDADFQAIERHTALRVIDTRDGGIRR